MDIGKEIQAPQPGEYRAYLLLGYKAATGIYISSDYYFNCGSYVDGPDIGAAEY
jgi:hypothetical protein